MKTHVPAESFDLILDAARLYSENNGILFDRKMDALKSTDESYESVAAGAVLFASYCLNIIPDGDIGLLESNILQIQDSIIEYEPAFMEILYNAILSQDSSELIETTDSWEKIALYSIVLVSMIAEARGVMIDRNLLPLPLATTGVYL